MPEGRPIFDVVQARYVLAVAEERHFTRAAQRLGVSQQTISTAIRRLEEALGVGLFARTSRTVELTGSAERLLPLLRDLVESGERLNRAANTLHEHGPGSIRIAYTESSGHEIVPAVLEALRVRWPDLHVRAQEAWASEIIDRLHGGEVDVGFGRCLTGDGALLTAPVRAEGLALIVPDDHRLATRPWVQLEDLAGEQLVMFPRQLAPGLYAAIVTAVNAAGVEVGLVDSQMLGAGGVRTRLREANGIELCSRSRMKHPVPGLTMMPVRSDAILTVDVAWSAQAPDTVRQFVDFIRRISRHHDWLDAGTHLDGVPWVA